MTAISGVLGYLLLAPALGARERLGYHPVPWPECQQTLAPSVTEISGIDTSGGPKAGDDAALMAALARKDQQALAQLYQLYAGRLGRYLSRLLKQHDLVDEVVNDVLLVAWNNAGQYDASLARLSTWLFGIAHNKALKALARLGRHRHEVSLYAEDDGHELDFAEADDAQALNEADPQNPERTVMGWELGQHLYAALETLSPEHRAVIELAFAEGYSYEDIAGIMDCPVNTVKTRMFHARRRLAQCLGKRGIESIKI